MKRVHAVPLLFILPCVAGAQALSGATIRAGYTVSSSFTDRNGFSGSLEGPEVGLDLPIGLPLPVSGLGGLQFALSPSFMSGTGGFSGSPERGNVYRLIGTARLAPPGSPVYIRFGTGYAYAADTQSQFTSQSAYEAQFGVGMSLTKLPVLNLSAEILYHQSSVAQVRGWTFGLSARF
ncbi:MAG TPA: hypothetical protein VKT78_09520 [Fimbriimonadaceae bacterium]|nr:hypothetical protein [Fimbriimonadaceae bacterium]